MRIRGPRLASDVSLGVFKAPLPTSLNLRLDDLLTALLLRTSKRLSKQLLQQLELLEREYLQLCP